MNTKTIKIGISIMIKKPMMEMPGAFSFVKPMKGSVWTASLIALLAVAFVLRLVQRNYYFTRNQNTFRNTMWFTIASIFRQATSFTPR